MHAAISTVSFVAVENPGTAVGQTDTQSSSEQRSRRSDSKCTVPEPCVDAANRLCDELLPLSGGFRAKNG